MYDLRPNNNRSPYNRKTLAFAPVTIRLEFMKVLPVLFAAEHKHMLSQFAMLASKSYLGIPKEFDKLIISLRTAYSTELSLDKEMTSYSDSLDSSSLAVKMYHRLRQ